MIEQLLQIAQTQIWQVSLLFVVVFLVSWMLRNKRPHLALLLWILFFIKCLVPPVVHAPVGLFAWHKAEIPSGVMPLDATTLSFGDLKTDNGLSINSRSHPSPITPASNFDSRSNLNLTNIGDILLAIWAMGVAVSLACALFYYWAIRQRIFREVLEAPSELVDAASSLALAIGIPENKPNLVVSKSAIGPLVFGFLRPTIVLPSTLLESGVAMKPVLAHEICHIWRRDHLLSLLQLVAQILFWFHPFVWLASRKVNQLCEICCDDDTIRLFDLKSKSYASGLLDVLDFQRILQPIRMAPGIRPVEITKQRIRSITERERIGGFRRSYVVVMCVLLGATLPASGSSDWSINLGTTISEADAKLAQRHSDLTPLGPAELIVRQKQLDGLLGKWEAKDESGQVLGLSEFTYERSGKMLKEEWVSNNSETAQGVSYFDPNRQVWRLTWVTSRGVITESSGVFDDGELLLLGESVAPSGQTFESQTTVRVFSDNEFRAMSRSYDAKGKRWGPASTVYYYRRK